MKSSKMYELGYVASPLNAGSRRLILKNMRKARNYEKTLNMMSGTRNRAVQGYVPYVLDDNISEERKMGLELGIKMLLASDALIICGSRLSPGMKTELETALDNNITVYRLLGEPTGIKVIDFIFWKRGKLRLVEYREGMFA